MILLKKMKSEEQLRDIQLAETEKERIQMEDTIGFYNFIKFLSQTVSFRVCFTVGQNARGPIK